jgi:DNA-binding IclR family transcriptional regulator
VMCYAVMIPSRVPGEGPCAASITLLKARATQERVPALVDDLRWLADALSDPLHRLDDVAGAGAPGQPAAASR